MELSFDPRYNVAYIRFQDRRTGVSTILISDDLNIDLMPDGTIYGIEFLNANEQLKLNALKILVVNRATGERTEMSLPAA